jgi:hypothetical protein
MTNRELVQRSVSIFVVTFMLVHSDFNLGWLIFTVISHD